MTEKNSSVQLKRKNKTVIKDKCNFITNRFKSHFYLDWRTIVRHFQIKNFYLLIMKIGLVFKQNKNKKYKNDFFICLSKYLARRSDIFSFLSSTIFVRENRFNLFRDKWASLVLAQCMSECLTKKNEKM